MLRCSLWVAVPLIAGFLLLYTAFFGANIVKVAQGGWFPILIGLLSFILLMAWKQGRVLLFRQRAKQDVDQADFIAGIDATVHRAPSTAVFKTARRDTVPSVLLHDFGHHLVPHERVLIHTVITEEIPFMPTARRVELRPLGKGPFRLVFRCGCMDAPDVPAAPCRGA